MTTSDPLRSTALVPPAIERVLRPFQEFARAESSGGIVLLACAVAALVWANSPWAESYLRLWEEPIMVGGRQVGLTMSLRHWVNDGLMAVFFFVVGLEIKRQVLVGELASWRRAALPVAAALGGMLVPASLYALLNVGTDGARGWGIPMATDIAFSLGVLALLGARVPLALKVFLAALAIADDIGAVLVIALFYSVDLSWMSLAWGGGLLALLLMANATGVRHPAAYALLGLALWMAFLHSGVHATVAGVLLAATIPARTRIDADEFVDRAQTVLWYFEERGGDGASILTNQGHQEALHELETLTEAAQSPLLRFEDKLHGIVAFGIVPLFALANAGVSLTDSAGGGLGAALARPVTLGVILGLVLGKPLGITLFAWAAVRTRLAALSEDVSWRALHGVSWLAGIGFTMSLFIAGLAFEGTPLLDAAKLGILAASLGAGITGWLLLTRWAPVPRSTRPHDQLRTVGAEPGALRSHPHDSD